MGSPNVLEVRCLDCDGSGEVPVNPDMAWSGLVQNLRFTDCDTCNGVGYVRVVT